MMLLEVRFTLDRGTWIADAKGTGNNVIASLHMRSGH
jgi:hypothetical protein